MVEVSLTVGKLDPSLALLLTNDHHMIEFPTLLLPKDVHAGSIVKISCERDEKQEVQDKKAFATIQNEILNTFGLRKPKQPVLSIRNVTQTSVVLEWEPIDVATADIISLALYKNDSRFGLIPTPLKRTSTKLSGLAIDTAYTFHLVLRTTAGVFASEKLTVKTHKMTDLTGITMCVGSLKNCDIDMADLEQTARNIGAKPLQTTVKLDTTHFICTEAEGAQCRRAQDLNIPVVRPEWVKACEAERRLVGVRAYYLNADPKSRPPIQRSRAVSQATSSTTVRDEDSSSSRVEPVEEEVVPRVVVTSPRETRDEVNGHGERKDSGPEKSLKEGQEKLEAQAHGEEKSVGEVQPEVQPEVHGERQSEGQPEGEPEGQSKEIESRAVEPKVLADIKEDEPVEHPEKRLEEQPEEEEDKHTSHENLNEEQPANEREPEPQLEQGESQEPEAQPQESEPQESKPEVQPLQSEAQSEEQPQQSQPQPTPPDLTASDAPSKSKNSKPKNQPKVDEMDDVEL